MNVGTGKTIGPVFPLLLKYALGLAPWDGLQVSGVLLVFTSCFNPKGPGSSQRGEVLRLVPGTLHSPNQTHSVLGSQGWARGVPGFPTPLPSSTTCEMTRGLLGPPPFSTSECYTSTLGRPTRLQTRGGPLSLSNPYPTPTRNLEGPLRQRCPLDPEEELSGAKYVTRRKGFLGDPSTSRLASHEILRGSVTGSPSGPGPLSCCSSTPSPPRSRPSVSVRTTSPKTAVGKFQGTRDPRKGRV